MDFRTRASWYKSRQKLIDSSLIGCAQRGLPAIGQAPPGWGRGGGREPFATGGLVGVERCQWQKAPDPCGAVACRVVSPDAFWATPGRSCWAGWSWGVACRVVARRHRLFGGGAWESGLLRLRRPGCRLGAATWASHVGTGGRQAQRGLLPVDDAWAQRWRRMWTCDHYSEWSGHFLDRDLATPL